MPYPIRILFCGLLVLYATSVGANLYKCEDPQGGISYSDRPCEQEERSSNVTGLAGVRTQAGPGEQICREVQDFSASVARLMRRNIPSYEVTNHIGGVTAISVVSFEIINYVYSFQADPNVPPGQIGGLSYSKCMGGGFSFPGGTGQAAGGAGSSGSGFVVDEHGHILTNHHVIERCRNVVIARGKENYPAEIIASNQAWDLALLKADVPNSLPVAFRNQPSPILGESVMVAGYPLKGLLSDDLQVTTGAISGLAGIRNDSRMLQVTAPIQPGNSGGPLFDASGGVIGVVVAKLNALQMARETGDIPQNINFAVNGELAKQFLSSQNISYRMNTHAEVLGATEIASNARRSVLPVICQ